MVPRRALDGQWFVLRLAAARNLNRVPSGSEVRPGLTVLLTLLVGNAVATSGSDSSSDPDFAEFTPHLPIRITGDEDLTPANGVVSGSGTRADPYIISGWSILAPSAPAIAISGTRSHLEIQRNLLAASRVDTFSAGILLDGVENVTISQNRVEASNFGIWATSSHNVVIVKNELSGSPVPGPRGTRIAAWGVYILDSTAVQIIRNQVEAYGSGIGIRGDCGPVAIVGNMITDMTFGSGIGVQEGCTEITIETNAVRASNTGISVAGAGSVGITGNVVKDVGTALDISRPPRSYEHHANENVSVVNNTFTGSSRGGNVYACSFCEVKYNLFERSEYGWVFTGKIEVSRNVFQLNDCGICATDGLPRFVNNSFEPSNEYHLRIAHTDADFRYNWWGSLDGPDPSQLEIGGGADVLFDPWLSGRPSPIGPQV